MNIFLNAALRIMILMSVWMPGMLYAHVVVFNGQMLSLNDPQSELTYKVDQSAIYQMVQINNEIVNVGMVSEQMLSLDQVEAFCGDVRKLHGVTHWSPTFNNVFFANVADLCAENIETEGPFDVLSTNIVRATSTIIDANNHSCIFTGNAFEFDTVYLQNTNQLILKFLDAPSNGLIEIHITPILHFSKHFSLFIFKGNVKSDLKSMLTSMPLIIYGADMIQFKYSAPIAKS